MDHKAAAVIEGLNALAQEHRLALFRALVQAGEAGMAAGAIATSLDMPASSLSFHLGLMERAGIVRRRRVGRSLIYSADYAAMAGLVAYLMENCCGQGAPTLCCPSPQDEVTDERNVA